MLFRWLRIYIINFLILFLGSENCVMKRLLVIGIAVGLSSCIAPMTRQEQLNVYRTNCLDYGFQWGTPEFAQCVKDQEYQEQKLIIESYKVRALEEQARTQRQLLSYPNYRKVKQKVPSTTHVQHTHIQHTYNPPQTIVVQEQPPQPKTLPMDLPPKQSSVQTQTLESSPAAPSPIIPNPTEILPQTQDVQNVGTSTSGELNLPNNAEETLPIVAITSPVLPPPHIEESELQRQKQLEKDRRDEEEDKLQAGIDTHKAEGTELLH